MSTLPAHRVRLARGSEEERQYYALRARIFCDEQQLFAVSDRDGHDAHALPIVCAARAADGTEVVIGVVRTYEDEPGLWYGGRLGVAAEHRGAFALHRALVGCAVRTAAELGARRFLAHVQASKVPLLERMHFRVQCALVVHGRPHALMEADLARYARAANASLREHAGDAG